MKSGNYDIGFAQDADADRLVILDEKGTFIGEDYSLALCIDYVLSTSTDSNKQVVVNLSTSNVIEWVASQYNAKTHYTKIGESNVTQGIKDTQATVGGEGNGGVIYPKVGWGRDSLVGMVIALKLLAERKQKVSEIVATYPKFKMLRHKFDVDNREIINQVLEKVESKYQDHDLNTLDGVKVTRPEGWIHVRPSNTEPIVRAFIECQDEQLANEWMEEINQLVAS